MGPTNAISLVVFSALAFFDPDARFDAYQATFLLGIMIGIIQILIAVFRLGDLTRYISESVVLGFMAGAGFLVAVSQLGNLYPEEDEKDSATLKAVRHAYELLGDDNRCDHCRRRGLLEGRKNDLYYLV